MAAADTSLAAVVAIHIATAGAVVEGTATATVSSRCCCSSVGKAVAFAVAVAIVAAVG